MDKYKCNRCGKLNDLPEGASHPNQVCGNCKKPLSRSEKANGDTSAAVGLIGGAALGASLFGPVGAIVGGIVGGILGKESKGVG